MSSFEKKEKRTGVFEPQGITVSFNVVWGTHRFTEEEQDALLRGETIEFDTVTKSGKSEWTVVGRLGQGEYNGYPYWGFQKDETIPPHKFMGHRFTDEEYEQLLAGRKVEVTDLISTKSGRPFPAGLLWVDKDSGEGKEMKFLFNQG